MNFGGRNESTQYSDRSWVFHIFTESLWWPKLKCSDGLNFKTQNAVNYKNEPYFQGEESIYEDPSAFQCLPCADGCESCEDSSPCIVTLNWVLRTILLILQCVIIGCLPVVVLFTYKYKDIKVIIYMRFGSYWVVYNKFWKCMGILWGS